MPRDASLTPICPAAAADTGCLPRGYRLRDFVIERVLAEGGFGVVYAAIEPRLQRRVAIKEYMPAALARRGGDLSVLPRSSAPLQDAFAVGLRSFINEARMLAGFDHPALARVLQFWEDKGTGFMVMPLYQAPTVRQWALARACAPEPDWLVAFIGQMLEALELVHGVSCLHRDIAPDNILLQRDRDPLLLDFGAARRVIEAMTQTLTAIVKPGYAPIEQYAQSDGLQQGPWTDLYALCATLHFMLTRRAPQPSVGRMVADEQPPLARSLHGRYPAPLLAAIDAGLAVRPADRPQSVAQFRALLRAGEAYPARPAAGVPAAPPEDGAARSQHHHGTLAAPLAATAPRASVEAPGARSNPGSASGLADRLWRRPVAPRTVLATAVLATLVSSAWVLARDGLAPAVDAAPPAVAVWSVVQEPRPITRPDAAAAAVPPDAPAQTPAIVAAEPSAPVQPAVTAEAAGHALAPASSRASPAMERPDAQPARPRESAARRSEPLAARVPALSPAPTVLARGPEPVPAATPEPVRASSATDAEEAKTPAAATRTNAPATAAFLVPVEQPRPAFPAEAVRQGIEQGRVRARLHVSEDGRVGKVEIVESLPRRLFDRAVLGAAGQWRYAPPGQPQAVDVEFVFRRDG